jgi:hypothetical protein
MLDVWVASGIGAVLEPVVPVFGLKPVIHHCRCNRVPRSVKVTSDVVSGIRCTCFQYCCCNGKGKRLVECWRKTAFGTRFWPKLRDATSAMEFSTPAMEATVRGPTWEACCMAASPCSSCPAVGELDLLAMRAIQATVGMLSDSTPAQTNCISTSWCSTMYCGNRAAISKSELVRRQGGVVVGYNLCCNYCVLKLNSPDYGLKVGFATEPYAASSCGAGIAVSVIVVCIGDQFFDKSRPGGKRGHQGG